jgi:hypothetical protein
VTKVPVVAVAMLEPERGLLSLTICSPTIPTMTARPTTIAPRAPDEIPDERDGPPPFPRGAVIATRDPPGDLRGVHVCDRRIPQAAPGCSLGASA